MMQYYNSPAMNPQMGGMGMGQMGMGDPRMQQQMQMQNMGMQGMNGMGAMGAMAQPGIGAMGQPGMAYRQLGYDYAPPALTYKPETSWGAWDLATHQYSGSRMDRSFFDNIIATLTDFFGNRHLSEDSARDAHRRVYYAGEGVDAGNKTLGGAAAYQAYLIWDRDHYSAFHTYPSEEQRQRLCGLAVAELFALFDRVQPRSQRAAPEEAAQYAAATAKYLFERHYELPHNHGRSRSSRHSGYGADGESDAEEEMRMRRRSMYNQQGYGMGGMQTPFMGGGMQQQPGMMGGPGMMGPQGMGMPGMGMAQPGMGAMGMPGTMQNGMMGQGYGMGGMNGMNGMGGMGGMGMGGMQMQQPYNGMNGGMMGGMGYNQGMGGGMMMPGHGSMGEAQAAPGMHPYTYGAQSGVAYGAQPIDQMGNPTFPGGPGVPGRSWYGYGQPRNF